MKLLLALLAWLAPRLGQGALLPRRGAAPRDARRSAVFLSKREHANATGVQPWLYNPPPAVGPRAKPLEIPGEPLVLPLVDKMWGMQPSVSPPTIEPPQKEGETGLQQTVPPKSLDGWYATIPPDLVDKGIVGEHVAYYARCLGGPGPCPYTVPPTVIKYWERVQRGKCYLSAPLARGATTLPVTTPIDFAVGDAIMIGGRELKTIVGFGSIIIDTPLMFDYPAGAPIDKVPRPPPMVTTFAPWSNFRPIGAWFAGPAPFPAPAPAPFAPAPAPFLAAYVPGPFLPVRPAPGPAPGPRLALAPGPGPGPAPAPAVR